MNFLLLNKVTAEFDCKNQMFALWCDNSSTTYKVDFVVLCKYLKIGMPPPFIWADALSK